VAVFDPNRKHNSRGEQRQQDLLRAAAAVFGRMGYHQTTTNAIAKEAGVSPATLYQFFPNKEAIASALATAYAREMAQAEREIDSNLGFTQAIEKLLDVCIDFNRNHPEFHALVTDAPLSVTAREEKQALGQAFVDFVAARIRQQMPTLTRSEAAHHGRVALLIFRGILEELTSASPANRPRLHKAMRDAILRYLEPIITKTGSL